MGVEAGAAHTTLSPVINHTMHHTRQQTYKVAVQPAAAALLLMHALILSKIAMHRVSPAPWSLLQSLVQVRICSISQSVSWGGVSRGVSTRAVPGGSGGVVSLGVARAPARRR